MRRSVLRFTLSAALISMAVWVIGALLAPGDREAITYGVVIAFAFQVLAFWLLAGVLFPGQPALTYGLSMLGRFLLVAVVAILVVPQLGLPPVAMLFSLLATLFATTLLEPVFLRSAY